MPLKNRNSTSNSRPNTHDRYGQQMRCVYLDARSLQIRHLQLLLLLLSQHIHRIVTSYGHRRMRRCSSRWKCGCLFTLLVIELQHQRTHKSRHYIRNTVTHAVHFPRRRLQRCTDMRWVQQWFYLYISSCTSAKHCQQSSVTLCSWVVKVHSICELHTWVDS